MIRKLRVVLVLALPILAFALMPSAAAAQSYNGNWPATVSRSKGSNGTYCLTLTDNGSNGWPHSGQASLVLSGNKLFGTFQLIDGLLVATFESPSDTGQNAGLVFTAHASNGVIAKGVYEVVYGGEEFDSGVVSFGTVNTCTN